MKIRRSFLALLGGLAASVALTTALRAQTVTTDPVGAVTLTLKGGSDTHVSLPFHRPVALETQVSSNASISSNIIGVSASANLTANQFIYSSPSQTNTYYLQFTSGNRAGMYYTVTANDASTITINPNGDAGLSGNVANGDTFRVIPFWTLNTLFPSGQGLHTGQNFNLNTQSVIITIPGNVSGINLSAAAEYFYYAGSNFNGPGWRQQTNPSTPPTTIVPDVIFPPDTLFIVRHPLSSADTQLVLVGNVPMSAQSVIINALAANTPQDNAVSLPVPVSVTLAQSGLSNVLTQSTTFNPSDLILQFDPNTIAQNKSATAEYFYYTDPANHFNGPGWRLVGDPNGPGTIHDTDVLASPGQAFVIRLGSRANPGSLVWTFTPSYLPVP